MRPPWLAFLRTAPVVRPDRALVNPRPQNPNLLRRQRVAFRRHQHVLVEPRDIVNERTGCAFSRYDVGGRALASRQRDVFVVQPVTAALPLGAMTIVAVFLQDWLHFPQK